MGTRGTTIRFVPTPVTKLVLLQLGIPPECQNEYISISEWMLMTEALLAGASKACRRSLVSASSCWLLRWLISLWVAMQRPSSSVLHEPLLHRLRCISPGYVPWPDQPVGFSLLSGFCSDWTSAMASTHGSTALYHQPRTLTLLLLSTHVCRQFPQCLCWALTLKPTTHIRFLNFTENHNLKLHLSRNELFGVGPVVHKGVGLM